MRIGSAWKTTSLLGVVGTHGSDYIYDNYLSVAEELLTQKVMLAGYHVTLWSGYYCGTNQQMTHYAAICDRI